MSIVRHLSVLSLGVLVGAGSVVGALALPSAANLGAELRSSIAQAAPAAQSAAAPVPDATATGAPAAQSAVTPAPAVAASNTPASAAKLARLLPDEQILVGVYDRVSPAVVNITNRRGGAGTGEFPSTGAGSGVVIDDRGFILTNNHVVDDASRLEVTLADGANLPATLVGRDSGNDLAVIKIDAPNEKLTVAPLGNSDDLQPGQLAIAIGNPFGLERTITTGVISSVGRTRSNEGRRPIRNMIQTDAPINPGNSGGPLLNSSGEVIGINTAIESPVRGSVGIGFSVPINTAKRFLPQMMAGQKIGHPWIGISIVPMTPATAKDLGVTVTEGAYLAEVVAGSPAEKAGLRGAGGRSRTGELAKGGDIVVAIDGKAIVKSDDIANYIETHNVGDVVAFEIVRDGQRQTINVTLGDWPEPTAQPPRRTAPDFEMPDLPNIPGLPRLPIPGR